MRRAVCLLIAAAFVAAASPPAKDAALDDLLRRAGAYVRALERSLSVVVADEEYRQEQMLPRTTHERRMRSEVLFTWLEDDHVWFWVRNPTVVDGRPIVDSADRFARIYVDAAADPVARLRALRAEAARFNLGDIYRDFNDPTYVLLFLDPAVQPRFTFTLRSRTRISGAEAVEVTFAERQVPTLIQNRGANVPARGTLWVRTWDAAVARTRLTLSTFVDAGSTATANRVQVTDAQIDVDYAVNAALGLLLPARMEERYSRTDRTNGSFAAQSPERVRCTAVYSNFHRFETTARVVPSRN